MMVGNRSKQACQELGRTALETQEICKLAIESYFQQDVPFADETTIGTFLSSFMDKYVVKNDAGVLLLRAAKTGKRLHRCVYQQPLSTMDWMEFGDSSKVLNGSLELPNWTPLPQPWTSSLSFLRKGFDNN